MATPLPENRRGSMQTVSRRSSRWALLSFIPWFSSTTSYPFLLSSSYHCHRFIDQRVRLWMALSLRLSRATAGVAVIGCVPLARLVLVCAYAFYWPEKRGNHHDIPSWWSFPCYHHNPPLIAARVLLPSPPTTGGCWIRFAS
ncbi:unnamed protein product [Lactuca saligna]|uniref:Uncharacterized protein n=1 Tax=Lactuca saligna TaxID=75948 RepID=A0AA35ZDK6_LACSI|nr:unnamed protein product [Lactuca saligna]